jgi:transcriptional regulator with XRE-family HTH domain
MNLIKKPHADFAKRLRAKCAQVGNVAEICRGTGINRQQFQKYLDGTNVPKPEVLRRICAYLHITESDLIGPSSQAPQPAAFGSAWAVVTALEQAFRSIERVSQGGLSTSPGELQAGHHFCYFPLQGADGMLLRSLLTVSENGSGLMFRRLTLFPSKPESIHCVARGKNTGVVVHNAHGCYLVGTSTEPPFCPSIMAFDTSAGGNIQLRSGIALVRTAHSHYACRVVLESLPGTPRAREIIRRLGPIPVDAASVPAFVAKALSTTGGQTHRNQVTPVTADEMLSFVASSKSSAYG